MPCLNFESPALCPIKTHHDKMDTNSQECAYGPTHKLYSHGLNVSTKTSRDVVLNVSSRYCLGLVALTSRSRLGLVTQKSRSRLSLETLTSWSRHHILQPCFVGLRAIAVWPIDFSSYSKARLWLCMSKWRWISQSSKITIYKY